MAKFKFMTQSSRTATYDGPSGHRYVINIGLAFDVSISEDINFFEKNTRFRRMDIVGIIKGEAKPKPQPQEQDIFKNEIKELKLGKKSERYLLKNYRNKTMLEEEIEQGNTLDLPESKLKKVYKYLDIHYKETSKPKKSKPRTDFPVNPDRTPGKNVKVKKKDKVPQKKTKKKRSWI